VLDLRRAAGQQQDELARKIQHGSCNYVGQALPAIVEENKRGSAYSSDMSSESLSSSVGSFSSAPRRIPPSEICDPEWGMDNYVQTGSETLPLRWALDYALLATLDSALYGVTVITFDIRFNKNGSAGEGMLLAIATKSKIVLYETPRGKRAFDFLMVCDCFARPLTKSAERRVDRKLT
jgi:hypothetical protein